MNFTRLNKLILATLLTVLAINVHLQECKSSYRSNSQPPLPYNVKNVLREQNCMKHSPEIFFHNIAQPSLNLLYNHGKVFFGLIMDKIEASSVEKESFEKTKEQWEIITKTVTTSFDSAIGRLETEWKYFIALSDTQPLPWEISSKLPLISEALGRLEYGYLMVEAVIRSGVKEIVGTLQYQLTDVIRKLESEISKISSKTDEVTELKLLRQMKFGLSKMKPSFITKLLEKVVLKALSGYKSESSLKNKIPATKQTFISEQLEQMAIVMHAFREKGLLYSNFWEEMSKIMQKELNYTIDHDFDEKISKFIRQLSNQDYLIDIIIQLISRNNNPN